MQKIKLLLVVFLFTFCSVVFANKQFAAEVDKKFQNYKKVAGISGALNSIGSDTLNNLMTFWAEDFRQLCKLQVCKLKLKARALALLPLLFYSFEIFYPP